MAAPLTLWQRAKAAASVLWNGPVAEATSEEIYGTPVPVAEFFTANGRFLSPVGQVYGPEQRSDRNVTLRSLYDHDRARNLSRVLAETNPNAVGLLQRLVAYNVGKGSSTEVHAAAEDEEPPKRLARKGRDFIGRFKKQGSHQNQWPRFEREFVWRLHVDGEFFLRFYPQKDGLTLVRFVEPQYVRPPQGEDAEGEWSYGIHTPDGDALAPLAYCVHDFRAMTYEVVEAQFVIHAKVNCLANQKRGVPSLYAVEGELVGAAKLRHATREGEKNRASINYFRRHKAATQGAIEGARADRSRVIAMLNGIDPPGNASDVYVEVIEPGSTIDIPEGLDPLPPPGSPNTQGSSESVKQALEAVAARFGVPFWIASGDSGATNFAASLTAESPFAVTITDSQADLAEISDACQTKALEIGAEQGLLPEDVLEQIDLLVSFPSPVARNKLEETSRREKLYQNNILSEKTWGTEEGYDPEKEHQQIIEERRDAIPPQPTRVPALPVDASTGQTAPGYAAPSGTPAARYQQLVGPLREQSDQRLALVEALLLDLQEASRPHRQEGEVWKGPSGRWFTLSDGHVVPHKGPDTPEAKDAAQKAEPDTRGGVPLARMGLIDRLKHAAADLGFIAKPRAKSHPFAEVSKLTPAERADNSPPRDAFVAALKENKQREASWDYYAGQKKMTKEEAREHVAGKLEKMIEGMDVCMRVDVLNGTTVMEAILDSGHFKNQFWEGIKSQRALNDRKARSRVEEDSMGVPPDIPPERRPNYGYLSAGKVPRGKEAVDPYGGLVIKFKPSVKERMTVSFGDSLMGAMNGHFVSSAPGEISPESIDPAALAYHGDDVLDGDFFDQKYRKYVEAHVHDGLPVSDVESIEWPSAYGEMPDSLKSRLTELGIPWSTY